MEITTNFNDEHSTFVDLSEHGSILGVQFSPYEWSSDVILIAFKTKIFVGQVNCNDCLELKKIVEFQHADVPTAMYLSPQTAVNILPVNIEFCTGGNKEFVLRVIKCNLKDDNACKILRGHKNYINDICYTTENEYISSVSDDCTARVWEVDKDYECVAVFNLTSPGMSVNWHREDPLKLLVAEKCGLLRYYNVQTQRPILSFDFGKTLSSAHWAPLATQTVASLHLGELVLWDVTKPSTPRQVLLYTQNGGNLKFNQAGTLVATVNKLEGLLKVTHASTLQQRLSAKCTSPSNVTWHTRLPIVCVGDGRKLCFFKVVFK